MPTTTAPTIEQLKRAITVSEQIEKLRAELVQLLGGNVSTTPTSTPRAAKKGKRTMSAAARAKIAAAQRARWAKSKGEKAPAAASKAGKPKRKGGMSAAGRAAIVAAQKARWAKVKAAKAGKSSAKPKASAQKKKVKRNISPEARARIVAAVKSRWAKQKAAKAPTEA